MAIRKIRHKLAYKGENKAEKLLDIYLSFHEKLYKNGHSMCTE